MSRVMHVLCFVGVVFFANACGLQKEPYAGAPQPPSLFSVTAMNAFGDSVHLLTQENCAGCHGSGVGPQFVSPSLSLSYQLQRNYVDFTDIPNSRFVDRMMDGHCGAACQSDGSEMIAAIEYWWNVGEVGTGGGTGLFGPRMDTVELAIPAALPTGNVFALLTWQLNTIDPVFAGCTFRLDIQRFADDAYLVRDPTIITADGKEIAVEDIRVLINGDYDPLENNYTGLNVVVPEATARVLTTNTMVILQRSSSDRISISFGLLELQ